MSATEVHHTTIEEVRREIARDQYSETALLYDELIGSVDQRTYEYKHFFGDILRANGCLKVLDVACGTGYLFEGRYGCFIDDYLGAMKNIVHGGCYIFVPFGFETLGLGPSFHSFSKELVSHYVSRPEVITKANWKTLTDDIGSLLPDALFDAVICLANSFAHIYDEREQKKCLSNFVKCLKPGGLLLLDHRNYDAMINGHPTPKYNAYYIYKKHIDTKTSIYLVDDNPELVTFSAKINKINGRHVNISDIRLWYYPHRLSSLTQMLEEVFDHRAEHRIYGDFKPLGEVPVPGYYLHVIRKPEEN